MSLVSSILSLFKQRHRIHPALRNAPGPSPWFLRANEKLSLADRKFHWRSTYDRQRTFLDSLVDDAGKPYLALTPHCYVQQLTPARLLVWKVLTYDPTGRTRLLNPVARFAVVDFQHADPFAAGRDVSRELQESQSGFLMSATLIAEHSIPAALLAGRLEAPWPDPFHAAEELLVLSNPGDRNLSLWVVRPREGLVDVYPQDWYNEGPYDFGYEWVAMVARVPGTGGVVGECVRLPPFTLDASLRRRIEA